MPKRLIALVAALVLVFAIAGCSSGGSSAAPSGSGSAAASESASPTSESAAVSSEQASTPAGSSSSSSLFTSDEWPENEVTADVPTPHFSVGIDSMTTGDRTVSATWKGASEDEVAAYVEELKQAGFTNQVIEQKSSDMYNYFGHNADRITDASAVNLVYRSDGSLSIIVDNYKLTI